MIADELPARKMKRMQELLCEYPRVRLHFMSDLLIMVALGSDLLCEDLSIHAILGVFSSIGDLRNKLMRYIREFNRNLRLVKWHYVGSIMPH